VTLEGKEPQVGADDGVLDPNEVLVELPWTVFFRRKVQRTCSDFPNFVPSARNTSGEVSAYALA